MDLDDQELEATQQLFNNKEIRVNKNIEEDIKILESFINELEEYEDEEQLKQAIEHLIARNKELTNKGIELATDIDALETDLKELKEKNKELEQNYINPSKARFSYFDNEKGTKVVIEGFIPKSKVKEKIEELEKDVREFEEYWSKDPRQFKREMSIDYYKLEALQELLEESEK